MIRQCSCRGLLLAGLLLVPLASIAAAPQSSAGKGHARIEAELQETSNDLAAAHARNMTLQAQVADLEKQNASRKQALQQRDAEIAALQKKLAAAGVPAPAATAGP